jgi:hypothetical protein
MNFGWGLAYFGGTVLLVRFGSYGLASARMAAYVLSSTAVFLYAARYCWPTQKEGTYKQAPEAAFQ